MSKRQFYPPSSENPSSVGTLTIPDGIILASREKPVPDDFGQEPTSAEVVALVGNVLPPANSASIIMDTMTSADIRDTTMTTSTDADLVERNEGELTWGFMVAILAIAIGGSFQSGYQFGWVISSKEIIEKFIRETAFLDNERRFRETKVWIWTSVIAAHALGGILGSMAASSLADKYGRKATVFFNNIWATIGAVLMMVCYSTKIWYFILLARLVFGFNAGITSVLVPVYLTELSPDNLRGTIGTFHQLFISLAILIGDVFSFKGFFGTADKWQQISGLCYFFITAVIIKGSNKMVEMVGIVKRIGEKPGVQFASPAVLARSHRTWTLPRNKHRETLATVVPDARVSFLPVISQLILLKFCPESPHFSLLFEDDETEAEAALNTLRGTPDVQNEIMAIKSEISNSQDEPHAMLGSVFSKELRWATTLSIFLMLMRQLSGMDVALQYRFDVIVAVGLTADGGLWAVCGLLFLSVFTIALSAWLVDSSCFGRRPLLLIGIFGMFFSSVAVVLALVLIENRISIKECRTTGIFFAIVFLISYSLGPGSIPWFYITELYATSARANGMSFACAVGWTINFVIAFIFPIAKERFSSYAFLIFVLPLFASGIISLIHILETKGKSIREIRTELEENRPSCL
ncbi:unnamed protein product [Toxocara canis]|uniref:MFS domain-containing protein n=1 Tax=Toxocara canis TaxID=6265 RepID=A0A183UW72_TOXCA|nr:unnamed protein product [Toxocara canis]